MPWARSRSVATSGIRPTYQNSADTAAEVESGLRHVYGPDTQLIEDGTYFVIESNGAVVAAAGWSRRATLYGGDQAKAGPDPLLDPARDPARIRAFYVAPTHARRFPFRGVDLRAFAPCATVNLFQRPSLHRRCIGLSMSSNDK